MIALITAACLLGDSMLYIILPIYWKEVGLVALYEVGILLSVNRFIRLPLNPIAAWLFQKMGLRAGILMAVVLAGIATWAYGQVHEFWIWLILRCVWGISWTFLRLGAFFTIAEWSNVHNRGYHMGLYNGLFRIGSLIGMLAGGVLTEWIGITTVCTIFSLFAFLSVPFVFQYISPARMEVIHKEQTVLQTVVLSCRDDKLFFFTMISGLLIAMIYQGMFTSTLSHLIDRYLSSNPIAWTVSLGAAAWAGILQALRWGWEPWLAPWIGNKSDSQNRRRPLLIMTLIAASLLFLCIPMNWSVPFWFTALLGIQVTATLLTTLMDALAADAASHSYKMLKMAAYSFMLDFGAAMGPFLSYLLTEEVMYQGAAVILFLLGVSWTVAKSHQEAEIHHNLRT